MPHSSASSHSQRHGHTLTAPCSFNLALVADRLHGNVEALHMQAMTSQETTCVVSDSNRLNHSCHKLDHRGQKIERDC